MEPFKPNARGPYILDLVFYLQLGVFLLDLNSPYLGKLCLMKIQEEGGLRSWGT